MTPTKKKVAKPFKKNEPKINLNDKDQLLESFPMGRDRVVMSINRFGKKPALDLRRFYPDDEGTFQPTAKGIRIPFDMVKDVVHTLETHYNEGAFE